MDVSFTQILQGLAGLIKYAVLLVLLVAGGKFLPGYFSNSCSVDSEDLGMRDALGKSTMKLKYLPTQWNEAEVVRGDIVVAKCAVNSEEGQESRKCALRVVAAAGDRIEWKDEQIFVNGKAEKYPGVKPKNGDDLEIRSREIPRGYVYLLPDNRVDTLVAEFPGLVPMSRIIGKVVRD